jgi:peptide/nickel transport system permease protein
VTEIFVAPPVVEPELAEAAPAAVETVLRAQRRRRSRPPVAVIVSITWLVVVVLAALFADLLPIADPTANVGVGIKVRPFTTWSEPLGTDGFGRSMLTRVIYGSRLSLAAGIGSVALAMAAGLAVGTFAGYRRGRVDWFVGVVTDAMLSIPSLVLLLAIVAVLQPSLGTVILGLSLIAFPNFLRLARANTLRFASAEFVVAARGLGAKTTTVIFREILPSVLRSVSVFAAVICAVLILAEAGLSFLGLGVPPPTASWGNMISEGRQFLASDPHLAFVPVAALFVTILAMNTLGDWLRRRAGAGTVV